MENFIAEIFTAGAEAFKKLGTVGRCSLIKYYTQNYFQSESKFDAYDLLLTSLKIFK